MNSCGRCFQPRRLMTNPKIIVIVIPEVRDPDACPGPDPGFVGVTEHAAEPGREPGNPQRKPFIVALVSPVPAIAPQNLVRCRTKTFYPQISADFCLSPSHAPDRSRQISPRFSTIGRLARRTAANCVRGFQPRWFFFAAEALSGKKSMRTFQEQASRLEAALTKYWSRPSISCSSFFFAASRLRVGEDRRAPAKIKHAGWKPSHSNPYLRKCFLRGLTAT